MSRLEITNESVGSFRRPWKNCTTLGRAYDALRADVQAQLRYLQREIGFSYIRFHALFHEDMGVVKRTDDGSLSFYWHHVDQLYDFLLSIGLRPFVELNPMPAALAGGQQKMFYYQMNVTPPADYEEWSLLISAFAEHCVARYGIDEVRRWYFEVWNEPNLEAFWSGDQAEYFRLYESSARALKAVDPALRVGGPATAATGWIGEFIGFCSSSNVPVDFISTHLYPMDELLQYESVEQSPHEPGEFFADGVRNVREIIARSALPDLELHWTEWNAQSAATRSHVTFSDNRCVDSLYAAAFVARHAVELDAFCETLAYWAATDIFEEHPIPGAPFSCTYGMLTIHGFPKPAANAFRLLARVRGTRLSATVTDTPWGCGALATEDAGTLHLLLYNHLFVGMDDRAPWEVELSCAVTAGTYHLTRVHIAEGSGSALEAWEAAGKPANLTSAKLSALRQAAEPRGTLTLVQIDSHGRMTDASGSPVVLTLRSHEVVYCELVAAGPPAPPKSRLSNLTRFEQQLGGKPRE